MAYASVSDLFNRYDRREICSLISDNGFEVESIDAANSAILQSALNDASGSIEAALLRAGRYAVTDLQGLSGNSLSLLTRVCCDVAMQYLLERRPDRNPERIKEQRALAWQHLEKLAAGEDIFNLTAAIGAGQVHTNGPTISTFRELHLIRDRTRHYYPNRCMPNAVVRN